MSAAPQKSPFSRLLTYIKPHKREVYLASSYSVLNKLFDLAPPFLIGAAVEVVVKKEQSFLAAWGMSDVMHQLWFLTIMTVFVWGMESLFEYAFAWQWRNLAQTVQHELRLDSYSHIQKLDMAYFEEQRTGNLMAILNDDVNQLERFLDGGANDLLQVGTTVITITMVFFFFSPTITLLSIIPIPLIIWGSFLFQRKLTGRYADVREKAGLLNAQLANNLSGIETIKSFTTEEFEKERIAGRSSDYRVSNKHAIFLSSMFSPLIRMVIVLGFTATLVYGGWMVVNDLLSVGSYSVMVFLTQRLLWPLTRLGATFDLYQRAMASTARVLNLLDTPIQIDDGDTPLPTEKVKGEIVFENVTFAYPNRKPILQNLSVRLPAGKTLAIVGSTGSGKSTLIRLLLRFYEPQEGRILLDGHDIRTLPLDDLRSAVGLVSQQVFLFHGDVEENVIYGKREKPSQEELEKAVKVAEAHGFIEEMPQGFQTLIGERGQKLSGGQRQRLSIARAILKNPPVLVLDEATSAVDNETEAAIQRSLEHITKERSTMIIAHRLSTIRHADQIVVLEHGQICEQGLHEELLENDGVYARLWRVQTGEKKV